MKSVLAVAAVSLFAAVQAQDSCAPLAAKVPSCAAQCIAPAAASVGCTNPTDFACQCKNTDAISGAAASCVLKSCGEQQGLAAQASASALCACVSTAVPSSASAAPSSASAAPVSASAVPTSAAPASEAASSMAMTTAAASAPYPSREASQVSDGQIQVSGAAAPTGTAGNSTTPVPFTGAGIKVIASVGAALAAFAAGLAVM